MKGFLAGSLALIVLYVAVQPGSASKAASGGNVLVALLQRVLSPQVAGVPNHGGAQQLAKNAVQGAATAYDTKVGQTVGGVLNQQAGTTAAGSVGAAGGQALNNLLNPTGK